MSWTITLPEVVEANLHQAIHEGDMHYALHCAALIVMDHPEEAEGILQSAAGIAGGIHHSPHLVAPEMDRVAMVKRGLMADLEHVFEKRAEAFLMLERIEVSHNQDGQLEAIPVWSE